MLFKTQQKVSKRIPVSSVLLRKTAWWSALVTAVEGNVIEERRQGWCLFFTAGRPSRKRQPAPPHSYTLTKTM